MITFITSHDFVLSASYLDKKRLFKQYLEATQLLERIELLKTLSIYFDIPYPDKSAPITEKYNFIRQVTEPLKFKGMIAVWTEDGIIDYEPRVKGIKLQHRLKVGHIYHPIVPLWMHYEEALII